MIEGSSTGFVKSVTWEGMSTVYVEFSEEALRYDWALGVTFVFQLQDAYINRYPLTIESKKYIDEQNAYLGLDSMASIKGCRFFNVDPKFPNCLRIDLNAQGRPTALEVRFFTYSNLGPDLNSLRNLEIFQRK